VKFKGWLFRLLFPKHDAAKGLEELRREYERKFSTWQRSPLDESKWVARFVALDADYKALENDNVELRVKNMYLTMRINELKWESAK
jgi:hypothetical protein